MKKGVTTFDMQIPKQAILDNPYASMMYSRITLSAILFCLLCNSHTTLMAQQPSNSPSGKWSKGPSDRFTGDVWVNYIANDTISDFLVSTVLFEPNARSNWHYHLGKQIILAIDGEGYYKEKGKAIKKLKKGEVVVIEPGTIHSHGSFNSNKFTQAVMMNGIRKKNATTWLEKVTEEELNE
jgi:quercetin dioxygenase-like cupin family protein